METALSALIDWHSSENHCLLNPRLPSAEKDELFGLLQSSPVKELQLQGHIWMASSGSAKGSHESLKLIALSKKAILKSSAAVNKHLKIHQEDKWIQALPRFHVGGLSIESRSCLADIKWVTGLRDSNWDGKYFVSTAVQERATLGALVPTQIHDLVAAGLKSPPSFRAIVVGGAALPQELYQKARELGWPLLPSYGMTECSSQVATADLASLQSSTRDFPELQLLEHCQARVNADGFLQLQSASLLTGYAQIIDQKSYWISPIQQGWYQTTDRVELRIELGKNVQASFLRPMGREQDFVKIMGEGVNLAKVREVLARVVSQWAPQLQFELAVGSRSEARAGVELILFISAAVEKSVVEEILPQVNQLLLPFERIVKIERVAEIPRTALGKVKWDQLLSASAKI